MNNELIRSLINNTALLVALGMVYEIGYLIHIPNKYLKDIIRGLIVGVIGISIMYVPFVLHEGVVFDTRSILISISGIFFGWIPTVIAMLITAVFRYAEGGLGVFTGILVILIAGALGLLWRQFRLKKIKTKLRWLELYSFGAVVHLAMLLCMFTFPWETALHVLENIALPVMLIYPVGTVLLGMLIFNQMDRNEAVLKLEESEERYRSLFFNNHAIMMIIDPKNGQIIETNPAANHYYGWTGDEMTKMNISQINMLSPEEILMEMANSVAENRHHFQFRHKKSDDSISHVEVYSGPIRFMDKTLLYSIVHDITEKKNLEDSKIQVEAHLRQQQKLEAIGTLAGGVAHEINNPINGIMNYAQLILDDPEDINRNKSFAREIIHETERVAEIVKNLLQFSRQEKQSHSYARLEDIIEQTVSLLRMIIKRDQIQLIIQVDENLPDFKCRSQQIQQVLMNLLTNARDALNEKYKGADPNKIIQLSTSMFVKENRRWIRVDVADHGNGISDEVAAKIFEPFFTTKPKDIGTGLGLSISYGIVSDHHGFLTFDTQKNEHTIFHLDLPVDNGWDISEQELEICLGS
ncbi:MAG: PAS domain S-box protein [Eubacteriaceae bacterium]|nr:PAS domain S-box protein [Eubacteriaceae bacterium]